MRKAELPPANCEACGSEGRMFRSPSFGIYEVPAGVDRKTIWICSRCQSDLNRYRNYGMEPGAFDKMRAAQDYKCLICECHESESISGGNPQTPTLFVDHCHETGEIRGLLCNRCNTGISRFKDNPAIAMRAAAYLQGNVAHCQDKDTRVTGFTSSKGESTTQTTASAPPSPEIASKMATYEGWSDESLFAHAKTTYSFDPTWLEALDMERSKAKRNPLRYVRNMILRRIRQTLELEAVGQKDTAIRIIPAESHRKFVNDDPRRLGLVDEQKALEEKRKAEALAKAADLFGGAK